MGRLWNYNQSTPHQEQQARWMRTPLDGTVSRPAVGAEAPSGRPTALLSPAVNRHVSSEMNPGPCSDQYPDGTNPEQRLLGIVRVFTVLASSSDGSAGAAGRGLAQLRAGPRGAEWPSCSARGRVCPVGGLPGPVGRGEVLKPANCQTWLDDARARLARCRSGRVRGLTGPDPWINWLRPRSLPADATGTGAPAGSGAR